tara:strand:+ start:743 stop:1036 length:294 start_codon:yes stop_codon:yes gene_type:complete
MSDKENDINDLIKGAEYLEEAMFNCYLIITQQLTLGDLEHDGGFWLPDADSGSLIQDIFEYYETREDYEKCQDMKEQLDLFGGKRVLKRLNGENYNI